MSQPTNEEDIRTMPPPPAPSITEQNQTQNEVSEFFTDSMDQSELAAPFAKERSKRGRKPNEGIINENVAQNKVQKMNKQRKSEAQRVR